MLTQNCSNSCVCVCVCALLAVFRACAIMSKGYCSCPLELLVLYYSFCEAELGLSQEYVCLCVCLLAFSLLSRLSLLCLAFAVWCLLALSLLCRRLIPLLKCTFDSCGQAALGVSQTSI